MEEFTRNMLVGTNNEAFIYMGSGGYNVNGLYYTIANGKVTVPAKTRKVILVIPKGNNDLARIHSDAIVLVVNIPNNHTLCSTGGSSRFARRN